MTMITKPLFLTRLVLFAGLALILVAAVPASASNPGLQNNLISPAGWPAFHPPSVDILAIVVTPPGDLTTTEAAVTATISMVLDSAPSDDVTIPVSSNDPTEGTVSPDQLVFTPANYDLPQDITITGVNDDVDDGNIGYIVELGPASSTDLAYNGNDPADIPFINTDNDTAGYTFSAISGSTTEAGGTATFTIALTSQPTADVLIGISSSNPAEGTVDPTSLTFTTANWSTSQTVTVTGVDDPIDDGDITYTIQTANPTGSDTTYNLIDPADVPVTNIDNDTAGISVSAISGPTTEASGDVEPTFTIVLNTKPTGNVTIGLISDNIAEGTVSPASLSFNGGNWDTPQLVTVAGVNDFIDDGNIDYWIVTAPAIGTGGNEYDGFDADDITVTNIDDDIAGITVSGMSGPTTEAGGTANFTVVLDTLPGDSVSLGLTSLDTGEGTIDKATLTFTTGNWNVPQTVTVTGINDDVDDGDINYTIDTAAATSTDPLYTGFDASQVTATNTDDDTAGILLTPNAGLITTEAGGTATFTVLLTSQPTADVILDLSSSNINEGDVAPTSMTFTTANWDSPKTATVTGKDDKKKDGNVNYQINVSVSSTSDPIYNNPVLVPPVAASVTNNDDDTAGITVSPTSGLVTTETGGTDTFSVVLNTEPLDTVTISLTSSKESEGAVSPNSLTFNTTDWNSAQDVTITGVDDDVDDGDTAYTITSTATSGDTNYNGLNGQGVSVTNTDDDEAGFTITPSAGLVTTETGGSASFEVSLKSEPTTDVTLNLSSDDPTEGTAPTDLTFTAANWDEPQTVTIVGVDDEQIDGDIPYKIVTGPVISDDLKYQVRNPIDVSVTNQDDDVAGFIVIPTSGLITAEYGLQAFFTIALDNQPTANVSLTLQSNDTTEGTISPTSLTFTPAKWDTPLTVTITGKDDFNHDGNIPYKILTNPATSTDPNYAGVDAEDVSVTNSDDDTPGFVISPGKENEPLLTSEGKAAAMINILLNTEPTANVVFTFTSQDTSEGVFSLAAQTIQVTFTPTNWNILQSIQLIGVDDTEVDGDVHYTVGVQSSSPDSDYNAKSQELHAINKDAPTIEWSLPVNHDPYYETCSLNPILLGVKKVGSEPVSLVHFYRWDDKLKQIISVGDDESSPYQVYLDPQSLNYQWNQIYAYAVDNESDQTQSIHVPLLIYRLACLYLPTVNK